MRWDDKVFNGEHDAWRWFVSRTQIKALDRLVVREHPGHRLWITAFDGGPITPDARELSAGWKIVDGVMVSPPLEEGIEIPCDNYDEWYLFEDDHPRLKDIETFVGYGGFNLADPRAMSESFDPTWERRGLDWLYPIQERFWKQLEELSPVSYVGQGDNDIVVTRSESFAKVMRGDNPDGLPVAQMPTPLEHPQQLLDREFYDKLGPEDPSRPCKQKGCSQGAIPYSVMCKRHHFEMIRHRDCPFGS